MKGDTMSRFKQYLMAAPLVAAALGFGASAAGAEEPPKPDTIVVNASGGAMNSLYREIFFAAFEEETGIRVIDTSPVDFGKLRAMVASGNVEWSVTEIGGQDGLRAAELGLLEPIDDSMVDRSNFPEQALHPYIFVGSLYSTVLGYSEEYFADNPRPTNWAEFWDVENFPGTRSMRNHPVDNLEFALLADGVAPADIYPIDMDRAFRKLSEIKPHVTVWWTTGAQPAQLLLNGEVVLATGWNGRFFDLIQKGAAIGIEWSGGALKTSSFGIPKGAADAYWGQKFLDVMTRPDLQARYAERIGYPGSNLESAALVDPAVAHVMPTYPENLEKQFWIKVEWWAENGAEATERWNEWMLSE